MQTYFDKNDDDEEGKARQRKSEETLWMPATKQGDGIIAIIKYQCDTFSSFYIGPKANGRDGPRPDDPHPECQ